MHALLFFRMCVCVWVRVLTSDVCRTEFYCHSHSNSSESSKQTKKLFALMRLLMQLYFEFMSGKFQRSFEMPMWKAGMCSRQSHFFFHSYRGFSILRSILSQQSVPFIHYHFGSDERVLCTCFEFTRPCCRWQCSWRFLEGEKEKRRDVY